VKARGALDVNIGTALMRQRFCWEFVVCAIFWGALRVIYVFANRSFKTGGASGIELSQSWWLFAILYFVIDVIMMATVTTLWRRHANVASLSPVPFWRDISEIVPFLFIFHFAMLLFEYPISIRLERVGLGELEVIVAVGLMFQGSAMLFRSVLVNSDSKPTDNMTASV
jgi:hypothetical protein